MNENEINFIDRLIKHIRRVQDNMIYLEYNRKSLPFKIEKWELLRRGMQHDLSKFNKDLIKGYILTNEYFRNKRLGKDTSHINIEILKPYWDKHEKLEKHHPEFKKEMSNLDVCEMCCDLAAMSQELKEANYTNYFFKVLLKKIPMLEKYKIHIETILLLLETSDCMILPCAGHRTLKKYFNIDDTFAMK